MNYDYEPLEQQQPLEKPEMKLPEIEEQIRKLSIEAARFGILLRQEYSTMQWKNYNAEYLGFTFTLGGCHNDGFISLQITSNNHLLKQIDGSQKLNTIIKLEKEAQKFVDEIVCAPFGGLLTPTAIYYALLNGWCNVPAKYADQYFTLIFKVIQSRDNNLLLKQAIDKIDQHVEVGVLDKKAQVVISHHLRKSRISA